MINSRILAGGLLLSSAVFGTTWHAEASFTAKPAGFGLHLSGQRVWSRSLQPNVDSVPAYLSHVKLSDGRMHGVAYLLGGNNGSNCSPNNPVRKAILSALDVSSGKTIWSTSTSGRSRCTTAAPAADPNGKWIYAPGLDGKAHKYSAGTGQEAHSGGWPVTFTLMPDVEKASANFTITGRHLYITTSGFIGDQGHYEGHLVTLDLRSGRHQVFNALCSNVHRLLTELAGRPNSCSAVTAGLFGRGQAVTDPTNHAVYIVSGNGPWNGHTNWGDSILKLDPSGSRMLDAFTPTNQRSLEQSDADLGSTGPAILPTIWQSGRSYHLLVQGGKGPACDNCKGVALRLLNRDNLSGRGGPGHLGGDLQDIQAPGGCEVLTAPAVWKAPNGRIWVFYANGCATGGYRLAAAGRGKFRLGRIWSVGHGGTTPVVKNGVLFVARSGTIDAYNPESHALLWSGGIGSVHWEYPLVTTTRIVMPDDDGRVTAFSLVR